ncbi:MAG: circularly permuted type 2 ATP-grasp protein [Planctomycetaceae bacterium]
MPRTAATNADAALLGGYTAPAGVYDELFAAQNEPRPHARPFVDHVERLGGDELIRRWQQAERLVVENGVTHNAHGEPGGRLRPWRLDGIPLLLPSGEWDALADGLRQRATLLDVVLKDLYGPQNLLRRGLLPSELLFCHGGFQRPLHGQMPAGSMFLHLYAADLARSGDGRWWVASDRTEDPGGAGYALENRIVLSRVLPEAFHDCDVRRLASYFLAFRDHLKRLVPQRDNPFIVLLSPGPGAPNFFEDVYLARYLGFTLVQGGDLGVRDDKVVLKTLGGLTPVDVVVRRVESSHCDPLELDGNSTSGVAGLLQAVRKGTVVLANALGSGLVQSPAFMAFLGPLCRALFGEDLKIPSVATWWCGSKNERDYVLSHLDELVIRDAFRRRPHDPVRPCLLSVKERDRLVAEIRKRPYQFVGQETVLRSCAPVWAAGRCEPWSVALRTFLVASGDGYDVMPGGLARVARAAEALDVAVSAGEGSKDAWVLSNEPVRPVSLLRQKADRIVLRRSGSELPSRVADNLYWLGRHVARADGAARLLRTLISRLATESESAEIPERQLLLRCAAAIGQIDHRVLVDDGLSIETTLPDMVLDESRRTSLRSQLTTLHQSAWTVRDRLSADAWRIVSRLAEDFPESDGGPLGITELLPRLNRAVLDLAAFSGLVADSMTRSQGWRFLDIGRRLEHALHVARLLSAAAPDLGREEAGILESLLEAADGLMTYRSRYLANLQAAAVLDLLLTDESNPRSIAYQLETLVQHIDHLPHDERQAGLRIEQRQAITLLDAVRTFDVLDLGPDPGRNGELTGLFQQIAYGLPELSEAITHRYLHHSGASRQFADLRPGA